MQHLVHLGPSSDRCLLDLCGKDRGQLRVPEQAIGELAEHIGAGGASFIQAVACSVWGLETQSLRTCIPSYLIYLTRALTMLDYVGYCGMRALLYAAMLET